MQLAIFKKRATLANNHVGDSSTMIGISAGSGAGAEQRQLFRLDTVRRRAFLASSRWSTPSKAEPFFMSLHAQVSQCQVVCVQWRWPGLRNLPVCYSIARVPATTFVIVCSSREPYLAVKSLLTARRTFTVPRSRISDAPIESRRVAKWPQGAQIPSLNCELAGRAHLSL